MALTYIQKSTTIYTFVAFMLFRDINNIITIYSYVYIHFFFFFRASSSGSMKVEVLRQPVVRVAPVEDNVIRQPRGPDNTKGFNHRS